MKAFKDLLDLGITFKARGNPLSPEDIAGLEAELQCKLPEQYRDYMLHANGGRLDKHMTEDDDGYCFDIHWPAEIAHLFPPEDAGVLDVFLVLETRQPVELPESYTIRYGLETWPFRPKGTLQIACTGIGYKYIMLGIGEHNFGKVILWCLVPTNQMESDVAAMAYETVLADSLVDFILALRPMSEVLRRTAK